MAKPNLDVVSWKAYYATDDVKLDIFNSKTTAWDDLPKVGVQIIVIYHITNTPAGVPYRTLMYGVDFYRRVGDGLKADDWQMPTTDTVDDKEGKTIGDARYEELRLLALADKTAP